MAQSFKPSHYETPEERLKRMILERLDDAAHADAEGQKRKFCTFVHHFLLLMKSDMPKNILESIEKRHSELVKRLKSMREDSSKSVQDREKLMVEEEYREYMQSLVDGIDSMRNSKLMQRQMAGIILSGKSIEELNSLGERIRKSDAVETVIEEHEGMEDGGEVE